MKHMLLILLSAFTISSAVRADVENVTNITIEEQEIAGLVDCWLAQPKLQPISTVMANECSNAEVRPQYFWPVAKRALIWGLRNHLDTVVKRLPKKWQGPVKKYGGQLANAIEAIEDWKEGACILALVKVGIPPAEAQMTCEAINFLL